MLRRTMRAAALTKMTGSVIKPNSEASGVQGIQETTKTVSSRGPIVQASLPRLKLRNDGPIQIAEVMSSLMTGWIRLSREFTARRLLNRSFIYKGVT
jgi:hypothetical protein